MEVNESTATTELQPLATTGGAFPSDWRVVVAADACTKIQDGTHFSPRINGGPYLYITSKNIRRGQLDLSTAETIDEIQHAAIYRRCDVKKGDLLLTKDGANTGNAALNSLDEEFSLLSSVAFLRFSQQHSAAYFLQQILSTRGKRQIEEAMAGNAITRLTLQKINQLQFLTPPTLVEQQAIAEALSDADALIETLSLLRAKKRQIKQGAMQELLTGRHRLPGFTGSWKSKSLAALARIQRGASPRPIDDPRWFDDSSQVGWVRISDVTQAGMYLEVTEQRLSAAGIRHSRPVAPGSLIMSICATVGKPIITAIETCIHDGFVVFEDLQVEQTFLYYALLAIEQDWARHGQSGSQMNLNTGLINRTEIVVPPTREEQRAVSQIFADIDADIAAIESRLSKARDLKQGMTQALLTGRIRLVRPVSNVIPLLSANTANAKPSAPRSAHNWQINEAVVIGVLAKRFGSEQFPLPRKRRVKLMYLLHRHVEGRAEGYLKKAAGPYNPNTKYKGPEAIALKNGYVRALRNEKYEGFVAGDKIEQAQHYFEQWYGTVALDWLQKFHYRKTDDLELLATVDMAMLDLAADGQPADVAKVRRVIAAHPEWMPKLSRELFSDDNIASAIAECQTLLSN